MAPPVSFTKATLSYPIYAADFDPYNRGYLVVGGGGGEGRSGVSNKITLLNCQSRANLNVVGEIELSRDEDSVTSLANLASKDGLVTLSGINSSTADQKSGKNEHLRAFDVQYPKRRRKNDSTEKAESQEEPASLSLVGKSSLFTPAAGPKPEQYQRVLKLSPAQRTPTGSKRIGAVATGLAKKSQIVIFDATKTPVQKSEIINTIELEDEAADLDITNAGPDFSVAWCTDYAIYEQTVSYDFQTGKKELTPKGPRNVYTISKEDRSGNTRIRPKYRSIRFLTDHHVLVLSNLPNKTGAELSILHLYPTGPAMVLFHKILPSHIKQAVSMDVCALDADEIGSRQFVVAVAGQDISIEVYTLNYTRQTDTFSPFNNFTTLRDVHPLQMTAIRFAPFFAPELPKEAESARPTDQMIRLASVSMGNTVVVETFALQPLDSKKPKSRYVLSHPKSERLTRTAFYILTAFIVLISAMMIQSLYFPNDGQSLRPASPSPLRTAVRPSTTAQPQPPAQPEPIAHADYDDAHVSEHNDAAAELGHAGQHQEPVDDHHHEDHNHEHVADEQDPELEQHDAEEEQQWRLLDLLHFHRSEAKRSGKKPKKAVVLRPLMDGSGAIHMEEVHDKDAFLARDEDARHWHELEEEEKHSWKQALIRAGEWTADEGESVLKGILFSSYAGIVGQVAAEALRGA